MSRSQSTASSKVEEYLRAESRLSQIEKPEQEEDESKPQYAWRLIRQCVKQAVDVLAKADKKDLEVVHGVHHCRKLNHVKPVKQIVFNRNTQEYVTLDGEVIRIFLPDGRKKEIIKPDEPMNRLMHIPQLDLYIGWTHKCHEIFLMDKELNISSMSEAPGPINALVYNENINEIVTVGPGFFTSWVFRYGGRHLLPRKTSTDGFVPEEDEFDLLVLEETASHSQKAFASHDTTVTVLSVFEGTVLGSHHELHTHTITAMLFFNPLKYLVTAAKDGCIKVWDEKWHLQLVFVGHFGAVNSLTVYPYGPLIMSSSMDRTVRIWSLETCDMVDCITVPEPVDSLVTAINCDNFCSMSKQHCDLWKVQHAHTLHSTIGHKVLGMTSTDHPSYPVRSLLMCKDSSVRIVAPTSGDIITTLLMNPKNKLVYATYAIAEEFLFAVFANGDIIKADTSTNPCTKLAEWKCTDKSKACNYLLVYEYVISADIQTDTWAGVKRAIEASKGINQTSANNSSMGSNRTLLLGGRKDGHICVFNWDTGGVEFEIEAHGTKGVLSMIANSKNDQLISAGLDNIIKVWRLYPYAQESLAPLMSFYCAHTPIYMTVMKSKLAVAFQEHSTATYSVVMYHLLKNSRHDHGPEDDHMNSITGLTSCAKMRLLASCSIDGTVRIWNEVNNLVKCIKLNATPHSLTFCSAKGDLLVGIGRHVHKIDYKKYMPKGYRFKMVSMHFNPLTAERALEFDENLLNLLSKEDVKRLKAARSSFKFTHFMDVLTEEENAEVMRERKEREEAFMKLENREAELEKMKDGDVPAKKKAKPTEVTKRAAFEKYLKIFYDRPKIELYQDDLYGYDLTDGKTGILQERDEFIPEREPTGFFPAPSTARKSKDMTEKPLPAIKAGGFVPNSVLVRLLWPQKALQDAKKEDTWRPPSLDAEQLAQISAIKKKKTKEESDYREHAIYLDYEDEDAKAAAEQEVVEEVVQKEEKPKMPEMASSFMQKVQAAMEKPPTPVYSPEPPSAVKPTPGQTGPAPPTGEPLPQRKPPELKRKPLVKFVSRPEPVSVTRIPTPPPRTPSPPPTPVPDFVTQFKGLDWFDKYFPNCDESNFPKPWTMVAFVNLLLKALNQADYRHKVEITRALGKLHKEEGIPNGNHVHTVLLSQLSDSKDPPTCNNEHEKAFIMESLTLLTNMGIWDRDFYVELMVQFLDADLDVRTLVMEVLRSCGLKDPHNYLSKELDGWDIWNVDDDERSTELHKMSTNWLEKWLAQFKIHLEDTIERLKKGHNVTGRVTPRARKAVYDKNSGKSILKTPAIGAIEEEEEAASRLSGAHFAASATRGSSAASSSQAKNVTVTFEHPPDASAIDNATYMDAINYFCDIEMEKALEKIRKAPSLRSRDETSPEDKNTVLVLPKLPGKPALVRLGETHTSKCRPSRETPLCADLKLPPITSRGQQPRPGEMHVFPSCISMPMKTVYMNPFPSPLDELELLAQQPILLTLKTSQKYFVPSRSFVPQDTY